MSIRQHDFTIERDLPQAPAQAFSLGAFMFLLYIPMGYYTDSFMYKRRQAKKARG